MDSEKELSSVCSAVLPPPPPPPPMLNFSVADTGRSQLLADIRKGSTLKKAPILNDSNQNELSPSDKLKKQTQDLLHAELTSTLKRRKPVVINEPPKYDYPTYDDSNSNNSNNNSNNANNANNNINNNINKNNDSSHSISANANTPKPLNVNAILSVVTGIKLPDVQYDANASASKSQSTSDKPKISHGKPNFTINHQKDCKTVADLPYKQQPSPKLPIKMVDKPEPMQTKLQRPSFFTSTSMKTDVKPIPDADSESQVEKCKSIFLIKSQKSCDNDITSKPLKCQPKTELIQKFELPSTPKTNSVDETSNGITFVSVANKKALFEKPAQGENGVKTLPLKGIQTEKLYFNKPAMSQQSNGKFNTLNSHRTINSSAQQKPGITTVTLNKNLSYGTLDRPKFQPPAKDRVDHFERTVHTVNETSATTTTTNTVDKYETKQFEQKTIVSFSKDLLNAPNNYPDQIRVKKTIISERSHAIPDNPFNNIRFSIKTNGQVIPKAK